MYVYIKQPGIVCLLCWFCLSCTLQRTEHPTLRQAGYLMEEHADSAFSLLKSISSLIGMTRKTRPITLCCWLRLRIKMLFTASL